MLDPDPTPIAPPPPPYDASALDLLATCTDPDGLAVEVYQLPVGGLVLRYSLDGEVMGWFAEAAPVVPPHTPPPEQEQNEATPCSLSPNPYPPTGGGLVVHSPTPQLLTCQEEGSTPMSEQVHAIGMLWGHEVNRQLGRRIVNGYSGRATKAAIREALRTHGAAKIHDAFRFIGTAKSSHAVWLRTQPWLKLGWVLKNTEDLAEKWANWGERGEPDTRDAFDRAFGGD